MALQFSNIPGCKINCGKDLFDPFIFAYRYLDLFLSLLIYTTYGIIELKRGFEFCDLLNAMVPDIDFTYLKKRKITREL